MKKNDLRRMASLLLLSVLAFPSCGSADAEPAETPSVQTESMKGEYTDMYTLDLKPTGTIGFDEGTYAEAFNRFTMTYTSAEPLRCSIAYTEDEEERSDEFFLEAGEHVTFSGLTGTYLSDRRGADLTGLTLRTCRGNHAEFILHDLKTEDYPVYSSDTYYLENDRFRVGIRLMWGGGICFISDERNPVSGLKNLVNQADTGRLIQQSYYGTGPNAEYTPGTFNNSDWRYNPVQGGDKYQNHSRIIDVVVNETSVYIKSQPQDWSLDGQITPSYMENTYTVTEDHIRVDNRFVDFSGWPHPSTHQELPAFYTVSYLDRFTWYDGTKPWTGDKLSFRDDLNFWGDPQYAADSRFILRESNTETWCAWTNPKDDYGIGLYVPNADTYFAGKHAYNASKNPKDGACNYVAPVNQIRMVSYQPIEYSYLMTTGSVDEIRAVFAEHRDFADNETLHINHTSLRIPDDTPVKPVLEDIPMETLDFTVPENAYRLLGLFNSEVEYSGTENAAQLTAKTGFDVQCGIDYDESEPKLNAGRYKKITVEYMVPGTNAMSSYGCELFLCTGDTPNATAGKSVRGTYIADGEYHTVEFDLSGLDFWKGTVHSIRFDFFNECADGDVLYVRSIRLS